MARVTLKGLTKSFGDHLIVDHVDLQVENGELLVLVGPSGCGKSTVLRLIAGLEEPDAGDIEIDGQRINEQEPRSRNVALVFQNYALYPHMTVRKNLGFPLRMERVSRQEVRQRVEEVAESLGLGECLDRKPRTLSGGQMQRVALGRALIRRPRLFLYDEPLSNLDAKMRLEMRAEIARLHRRLGTTALYVTHDQSEAMTLGDRVAVMHEGVLQQVGPPLEVYEKPQNRFVAGFLGTPPMNFIGGVGIRPHDVHIDPNGPIEAQVELVEPLGAEVHVHCRVGEDRVLVVTKEAPATDVIRLRFPEERQHHFS